MDAIFISRHPESSDHFYIYRGKNLGTDNPKFFGFHPIFPQYHLALTFAQAMAAMYGAVVYNPKDNKES